MEKLRDYQVEAIKNMRNGCILCGGVGSGKSRTALGYYYVLNGGEVITEEYVSMNAKPQDLYIITTAKKRDSHEWESDMSHFLISPNEEAKVYDHEVIIDSWNNIKKYTKAKGAFFIFDEQRLVSWGAWTKAFLEIAKYNNWILLSATPGDTWSDYIPVFVANGFYRNKTEFIRNHVIYSRFSKFPKIDRYVNTGRLIRLRNKILIDMDFNRQTTQHHETIMVKYDPTIYKTVQRDRWDVFKNQPIENASGLCYILRKIVNSDISRQMECIHIFKEHPRIIVFYNFDYELDILLKTQWGEDVEVAQWNGHKHQPVPETDKWVYLVQYTAGCEGWNCITTDTIIFYSQNYSYKVMEQAAGRIDRLNTPYKDLYYYHFKSKSSIDSAIANALNKKKKFNERKFTNWE
jgi:hypothetical protein